MNIDTLLLDSVPSTHTLLAKHHDDYPPFTIVAAREQTAGRGQRGNGWEAAPGENLTLSLIIRPVPIAPARQFLISETFALAVIDLLEEYDIVASVKWPNDIYVGDRKICGILIEHSLIGSEISHTILSAGINVNQTRFISDAPNPVSMALLTGRQYDLHTILKSFARHLSRRLSRHIYTEAPAPSASQEAPASAPAASQSEANSPHGEFMQRLYRGDGQFYQFQDNLRNERISAVISDVDPDGTLHLRTSAGSHRSFLFKEVSFLLSGLIKSLIILIISLLPLTALADSLRREGAAEQLGWHEGDTTILIPASVRSIPPYAFAEMTDLREVRFEDDSQLKVIGEYAFARCSSLRRVIGLPPGVGAIGDGAFRECIALERFDMPEGMLEVPRECFLRCEALREVRLGSRTLYIKAFAFTQCASLERIDLPDCLLTVGLNAFALCTSLREVTLPQSVEELESYAFAGCTNLRKITLPANPSRLGELILEDCPHLEEIVEMSISAPAFECMSWLADPTADPSFYHRVRLHIPPAARPSYRRAHCWRLFRL